MLGGGYELVNTRGGSSSLICVFGWEQPKGSSFTGEDKDFFKFRVGAKTVIPAFEEAIADMRVGGIRRIIVPEELGYPDNDFSKGIGPAPLTFAVRARR